ncbi:MAG: MerC family mercury resistance protein [Pseudomonadota bacterium]
MQIELVYEKTCPNVEATRSQLLRAFAKAGIQPHWQEWEISSPEAPSHVHGFGSPTILVNGRDVSGDRADGNDYCCRIYSHGERANKGVPPLTDIVRALKSAQDTPSTRNDGSRWQLNGAMLPAVGVAFLPKLACPACWPAYAGLLSSLGIGFFDYTPYLLTLTAVFVLIAVAALAYRAKQRRGHKPFLLGFAAGVMLLAGKFLYDSYVAMYAGLALLVLASLWNTWPRAQPAGAPCPPCVTLSQEPMKQS